jgi:penicillin-binding protein 1A
VADLNRMMRESLVSGTGKRAELPALQPAGKTGTTQDHRDAWFAGFSSQLVSVVWVGNDDASPMKRVSGSGLPAELWASFMQGAHKGAVPPPFGVSGGAAPPATARGPATAASSPAEPAPQTADKRWEESIFGFLFGKKP